MANFGSMIAWPLIVLGLFINSQSSALLINIGILAFSLAVLFQLVTLPVEYNASGRAVRILAETGMMQGEEIVATKKVLSAAALTYVASAAEQSYSLCVSDSYQEEEDEMTKSINERELVLGILLEVTRDGEHSHIALRNVLNKYQYLDKKERAFITRVTEGTLERMIELDYIINQFSNSEGKQDEAGHPQYHPECGLPDEIYGQSVPNSAACNEAVKLAEKKGFVNLKGFVNGLFTKYRPKSGTDTVIRMKEENPGTMAVRAILDAGHGW